MSSLTFAEQVKIILKRRGMTIKRLAEIIEEKTGKPMSRQNLTQRLGRDNFQEKDMRMIADILGCSFALDILGEEEEVAAPVNKKVDEITVGELAKLNAAVDEAAAKVQAKKEEQRKEEQKKEVVAEPVPESIPEPTPEPTPEPAVEPELKMSPEEIESLLNESLNGVAEASDEAKAEEEQPKKGLFGGLLSRFSKKEVKDVEAAYELTIDEEEVAEEEVAEEEVITEEEESTEVMEETPARVAEESEPEEEVIIGEPEINPYTGLEYETNSVRMHPTKVGYVQVYDRQIHNWTEMTEWAFLGYQERQKVLLGHKYKEPTYLD
ncbi:hypothetical protein M2145_002076 [Lachnospiraceae bacterium PF1-21]|uniref:Helix-turn-helix transcriptional regulator n=1 Tax=Ohessyouella blattaphilus TaxID=2949333 RepID=A0ABT1EJY3_9FIRM|nr:helix-turn-helix transcriptional regulator [Ohessyouella blattaphilus]MCP1111000.1 helix-turn-helix transcriptional regulator [Ohessyouella blattaphilus]MCR8564394.1 helix-turn-helix transcriptional regulator [Ohessyouella blattaphilus]MDL2249789.1 helix-turn-helix transcriptional regulator [Lachnospiraceae bacterium OttesenSCG-928-J05]